MTDLITAADWQKAMLLSGASGQIPLATIKAIQRNFGEAAVAFVRAACGVKCQCPTGIRKHFSDCHWNVCQEMADELETLIPENPAPAGSDEQKPKNPASAGSA